MAHDPIASRLELEYLVRARYGLIYVVSPEEERVEAALKAIGASRERKSSRFSRGGKGDRGERPGSERIRKF